MAKFGRFDPRNKKKDRNKKQSINKDLRIREVEHGYEKYSDKLLKEISFDDDDYEEQQLLT